MKRSKGIAAGALGGVIPGIVIACLGVIGVLIAPKVAALPTYNSDCSASGCHVYRAGDLRVTTNTDNLTVAPGSPFTVGISFAGGGRIVSIELTPKYALMSCGVHSIDGENFFAKTIWNHN